jgi:hypothetical protein
MRLLGRRREAAVHLFPTQAGYQLAFFAVAVCVAMAAVWQILLSRNGMAST